MPFESGESTRSKSSSAPRAEASAFRVGGHLLHLSSLDGRWSVTLDSVVSQRWYTTPADAWEAGVREADRLDRLGSRQGE